MTWLQLKSYNQRVVLVNTDHIAAVTPYPYNHVEPSQSCILFAGQGDDDGLIVSHTVADVGEMLGVK